tara:strand:+ start:9950 stop:11695 length:1746 start_codon:yes stop_codon:yes gene_type:complete
MCGIFCVIKKRGNLNTDKCIKTLSRLNHRGPDWSFYKIINKNVFMGQTVLSMTGKEKKNTNLNFSRNGNYFILFNGEIYNYSQINKVYLKKKIFGEYSDTQILVNLFEEKSIADVNKILDGMYAYIVYDKANNKIFASRDPQGEKILYYYESKNEIIFSSEINSIIFYLNKYEIDFDILKSYFLTRHFTLINKTIFKNIKILEPGSAIKINLNSFKIDHNEILNLVNLVNENEYKSLNKLGEKDLVENLDFLLKKNIREMIPKKRLFGSIFSGGIDSSLVSKYLSLYSNPLEYIFINHIGKDYHTRHIKKFSDILGTKITIKNVNIQEYYDYLKKGLLINNSPINSHSWVGQLIISKRIKSLKGKAVFGGEGADELFGGYETYRQKIENFRNNNSDYTKILKYKIFKNNSYCNFFKKHLDKKWLLAKKRYEFLNKDENYRAAMMLMDVTFQMSSNGLRGADLMGMAHSVEGRSLFFRRDILKFALNLPIRHKISLNNKKQIKTKILLKKVFLKYYPKSLILKKQGFAGFPNEMQKYLGNFTKYTVRKFFIKKKFDKLYKIDRAINWKFINTELFLKKIINK